MIPKHVPVIVCWIGYYYNWLMEHVYSKGNSKEVYCKEVVGRCCLLLPVDIAFYLFVK